MLEPQSELGPPKLVTGLRHHWLLAECGEQGEKLLCSVGYLRSNVNWYPTSVADWRMGTTTTKLDLKPLSSCKDE